MAKSIVTDDMGVCLLCGAPKEDIHHCIPGTANRAKSEEFSLVVPLCRPHHNGSNVSVHHNHAFGMAVKIIGQLAAERQWVSEGMTLEEARDKWRKEFGKSFV